MSSSDALSLLCLRKGLADPQPIVASDAAGMTQQVENRTGRVVALGIKDHRRILGFRHANEGRASARPGGEMGAE